MRARLNCRAEKDQNAAKGDFSGTRRVGVPGVPLVLTSPAPRSLVPRRLVLLVLPVM